MIRTGISSLLVIAFVFPALPYSQSSQTGSASPCPVEFVYCDASGVSVRVRNTSGKPIVGLVFNAAIADATEHWKWVHWDFDDSRPLRDFGWNRAIKPTATKRLTWGWGTSLDFEHIGGGAFVLTSVLFEYGSRWEDSDAGGSCKSVGTKHKKTTVRPVDLPPRCRNIAIDKERRFSLALDFAGRSARAILAQVPSSNSQCLVRGADQSSEGGR
jgi:hypothetical protein